MFENFSDEDVQEEDRNEDVFFKFPGRPRTLTSFGGLHTIEKVDKLDRPTWISDV